MFSCVIRVPAFGKWCSFNWGPFQGNAFVKFLQMHFDNSISMKDLKDNGQVQKKYQFFLGKSFFSSLKMA